MRADALMRQLAGLSVGLTEPGSGLAAARRLFVAAAPLLRTSRTTESETGLEELFQPLWGGGPPSADGNAPNGTLRGDGGEAPNPQHGAGEAKALLALVSELSGFAGDGARPVLIDLLLDLRRQAVGRRLSPSLLRLILPLALHRAGLVPKAAPGLLGGRLPFGAARLADEGLPVTPWLARALTALAREATLSARRLAELTRQHHAWRAHLAAAGLRGHARAPAILDLLAATPVLSATLVARHLGCTPQGAGLMLRQLADLGIVTERTSRSRFKIFLAGDLALADRQRSSAGEAAMDLEAPLAVSDPLPEIDVGGIEATLDGLFADLERLNIRATTRLAERRG